MKKYKSLVSALLCAAMLLVGCNHNPATPDDPADDPTNTEQENTTTPDADDGKKDDKKSSYTITFNTNGGSAIEAISVNAGTIATQPDDPTKDGYVFMGWYSDETFETEFDFDTKINKDYTLYAKWEDEANVTFFKLTFNTNGGSAIDEQSVAENTAGKEPATDPTKEGKVFGGWYSDEACTTAFSFKTKITANTTVYAKWDIVTNTVADGKLTLDLRGTSGYNRKAGGVVWTAPDTWADYPIILQIAKSTISELTADYTKVYITADVYDADGNKCDLATDYPHRLFLKAGGDDNFNAGIASETAPIGSSNENIQVLGKTDALSKVIIKSVVLVAPQDGSEVLLEEPEGKQGFYFGIDAAHLKELAAAHPGAKIKVTTKNVAETATGTTDSECGGFFVAYTDSSNVYGSKDNDILGYDCAFSADIQGLAAGAEAVTELSLDTMVSKLEGTSAVGVTINYYGSDPRVTKIEVTWD